MNLFKLQMFDDVNFTFLRFYWNILSERCCKTFYGLYLQILIISWIICRRGAFQHGLMFAGKFSKLLLVYGPLKCFTRVGSGLNRKQTKLQRVAKDNTSLLQKFVNYGRKKFYDIRLGPYYKTFYGCNN
jgi:hypothetical protein